MSTVDLTIVVLLVAWFVTDMVKVVFERWTPPWKALKTVEVLIFVAIVVMILIREGVLL